MLNVFPFLEKESRDVESYSIIYWLCTFGQTIYLSKAQAAHFRTVVRVSHDHEDEAPTWHSAWHSPLYTCLVTASPSLFLTLSRGPELSDLLRGCRSFDVAISPPPLLHVLLFI